MLSVRLAADEAWYHPGRRVHRAAMQIGDTITYDGRRYVVHGFDPEGVSPRMIYLEDVATGVQTAVPVEDLPSPSKRRATRLRLVKRPGSHEHRGDAH